MNITTSKYLVPMTSIIISQVNVLTNKLSILEQTLKGVEQRLVRVEDVASPEQAEQMRQLVQVVKADVSGMDEKLAMHQKQLERYVDTVDRGAREEAKKELQREKMLLETLLTQKLEQNLIKVLKSKMEDVQKDIQSVRSDMDNKVLEIQKALEAILRDQADADADAGSGDVSIEADPADPADAVDAASEPKTDLTGAVEASPAVAVDSGEPLNTTPTTDDIEISVRAPAPRRGRAAKTMPPTPSNATENSSTLL